MLREPKRAGIQHRGTTMTDFDPDHDLAKSDYLWHGGMLNSSQSGQATAVCSASKTESTTRRTICGSTSIARFCPCYEGGGRASRGGRNSAIGHTCVLCDLHTLPKGAFHTACFRMYHYRGTMYDPGSGNFASGTQSQFCFFTSVQQSLKECYVH